MSRAKKQNETSENAGRAARRPSASRVARGATPAAATSEAAAVRGTRSARPAGRQPGPTQPQARAPRASDTHARRAGDAAAAPQRARRSSAPRKANRPAPQASPATSAAPSPIPTAPSYEEIAQRAFQLYVERGGGPGDPLQDWLRAESELVAERLGA